MSRLSAQSRSFFACRLLSQAVLLACALGVPIARADDIGTALYVRSDSDSTTVISPHARAGTTIGETTNLDITYAADVWTSASIDVRASASVRVVTEQRDEIDLAVRHELSDLKLNAAYRFSTEHDYTSHGLTVGGSYDFADNAATFDLSVHAIQDTVGVSGDPQFSRGLSTIDTRLGFTQVIDAQTIAQATYELAYIDGFQASPYRFVAIGGTGIGCADAAFCLPEHMPDTRTRHAIAALVRRAVGDDISLGLTYRYYFDAWGLDSHTILPELGWSVAEDTLLSLRYRFYVQGAADFYRARYLTLPAVGDHTTHDRELSPLSAQRLAAELTRGMAFDAGRKYLSATLGLAFAVFSYDDFVGLSSVRALELTTALVLTL